MMRIGGIGIVGVLLFAFWVWALIDCITTDSKSVRNLPKGIWLVFVIFLFDIGAILWALLGRPANKHWRPARGTDWSQQKRSMGVEDRPRLDDAVTDRRSAELDRRLAAWEAAQVAGGSSTDPDLETREDDLAYREAELRQRELEIRQRELDARERDPDTL